MPTGKLKDGGNDSQVAYLSTIRRKCSVNDFQYGQSVEFMFCYCKCMCIDALVQSIVIWSVAGHVFGTWPMNGD